MTDEIQIKPVLTTDRDEIIYHSITTFRGHGLTDEMIGSFTDHATDWSLSRKLVTDRIVGFYLLHEGSIAEWAETRLAWAWAHDCRSVYDNCEIKEDLNWYRGQRGVEGIALVVLPEYRGLGYGAMLKRLPQQMGFQHVFGEHFKSAYNLHHWLKSRRLVAACDGIWVTLQDL
jgi:GNAT superfamily N-acetyltransferase